MRLSFLDCYIQFIYVLNIPGNQIFISYVDVLYSISYRYFVAYSTIAVKVRRKDVSYLKLL